MWSAILRRCAFALLFNAIGTGITASAAGSATLPGKVVRVVDGDTLDVLIASGRLRVRLQGVDAPERNQAGGAAASAWLAETAQNQKVQLEPVSQDQYERMVAIVHLGRRNLNRDIVRAGHAWAYRSYLRRSDQELCDLEAAARRKQQGLWAVVRPHAPWEHRVTRGAGPFTDYSSATARSCRRDADRRRAQH